MIAIIGGGIFGLSIGWHLLRAGQAVTIFEQRRIGRGAAWWAAGMLMPWKLTPNFSEALFQLQWASYRQWPDFAAILQESTGVALDYRTAGRYFVGLDARILKRMQYQLAYHQQHNFPLEWLAGSALRHRAPYLGETVQAAIFTPMAHQVDNRQVVTALTQAFQAAGGLIREQTPVAGLVVARNRVQGIRLADDAVVPCETVVITAGAWTSQLSGLPNSLSDVVRPLKGQSLMLNMDAAQPLISHTIVGPVYLVPRTDGRLIVGTTFEHAGFDTHPTAGGVYHILRKATTLVPAIEDLPLLETGAGLRPTPPGRRVPTLGPTAIDGVVIATGAHSHGILLSPIVGQTIGQLLTTGEVSPLVQPFMP